MRIWWFGLILQLILIGGGVFAEEVTEPLTLEKSVEIALNRSLTLHSAMEGVIGSQYRRKAALTDFFPKWKGDYTYTRYNQGPTYTDMATGTSVIGSRNNYNLNTYIEQPVFAGGSIFANYRLEKMGVELSKTDVETAKRDIVLQVREGYFNILNSLKLRDVAGQTVKQFEAQLEVAKAFFDVGIVPKNDVLQAEVKLAQAKQDLIKAENGVALTKSSFNILLRRDINTSLNVVDILEYKPSPLRFEDCVEEALRKRPEIKNAELKVAQAKESVKITRSGFFPTISVLGDYYRASDEPLLKGVYRPEGWTINALATLTVGDWGKTAYQVGESKVKVTQAQDLKNQLIEGIILEVKEAYLNMMEAEKNIVVAEKAIEQAEENLRMNEERYKYQVATSTEVLDAVTLLAQAGVNYYNALSNFNIAKAKLERSMGRMYP